MSENFSKSTNLHAGFQNHWEHFTIVLINVFMVYSIVEKFQHLCLFKLFRYLE